LNDLSPSTLALLFFCAVWAGAQNALAGGGSFVTLPALMFSGLDARMANLTSTIALFPGQVSAGYLGRKGAAGVSGMSLPVLIGVSIAGGIAGALLLLATPPKFFAMLVPWLVLFGTSVFAWGNFFRKPGSEAGHMGPRTAMLVQFLIGVYGGYYGGGNGFLMLAALTLAGQTVRKAASTKNLVIALINGTAMVLFLFTPGLSWLRIGVVALGALVGGWAGVWALRRVNEKALKIGIVILGVALTIGLFLRAH
jgi:uncharacterized membrane protein YfcA